jgi:alanyl aminopeptidase
MKMIHLLSAVLNVCSVVAFAADQPPKLRLSEVEDIWPAEYRVDLSLDPDKAAFTGSILIRLDVRKPAQTIWLNATRITVQDASLRAAGKTTKAKILPGGDDYVGFQFDAPVPVGASELRLSYSGVVQKDSSGVFQTVDGGNSYILTQFESTDARDAFPCFDEPLYKVPWQLTLHVPAADSAVSNTPITSETTSGSLKTYVFKETKPLPSYLVAFAVGPFEFVPAGFAGVNRAPVRIVTPKGRADEAKYAAEVTATILTRLETYFGIPFPYEKSDQVAVPITTGFGAMENAGMVTYGQNIILAKPETDTINRQRRYASVAAHELAHQWFGDLVTTGWWNDIWLNEAFATWMEQKILAEWKPEWKTSMDDVDAKLSAEDEDGLVSARAIRQAIETKDDIGNAFDGITYQKGAAVIGMFEAWMGPENFRQGVQSYMKQYAFRTATAGDFLDSLSSSGKKDVATPFFTFLNQAGIPDVSVAVECKKDGPVAHLAQSRFLPLGSKGSASQVWQIPVCLRYGAGGSECTLMTQAKMDVPLKAKSCPAWIEANGSAKGYYRMDYQGGLLAALSVGNVTDRLSAPERVDLIGNVKAMAEAGKIAPADALRMVDVFHADPERDVVERTLALALAPHAHLVPAELLPNYQRFLQKNFQAKARQLGWTPKAGEPDDVRLQRPTLLTAMATVGGDRELSDQARQLAEKWLQDRKAVSPDVAGAVLRSAGYYGDAALFERFLAEFQKTQDRQDQQKLLAAMGSFRDPSAIELGMQAVISKRVTLAAGYPLLFGGRDNPGTNKMSLEFVKTHFEEIMKDHPTVFGFDFGSRLPQVGAGFCDSASRSELQAFFEPIVSRYTGAPRALTQVLEGVDLCIANKRAQQPGVTEFLKRY